MDGTGNDALLKTTQVTEWSLNHGGSIPIAFGGFVLLGCIAAYVIAVSRGNVDPFLPLISDAAGSPPQNGLFGTFICIGGMFGVIFMLQRYMIVLEKNQEQSSLVTAVNKLSLFVGIFSMLGITLITGYPVNFYRNRDVWLMDVGLPHMIGGVMLFALGLVYIALQCALTLFLKTKNQMTLLVRVVFLFICTAAFVYHMITVPDNFGGISHRYYINNTENELNYTGLLPYPPTMGASLKLPIDTGGSYVASAITEWILVIFFCCFFFTFFNETQQYSLLIVIETHSTRETELAEEHKPDVRKLSLTRSANQVDTKPAPEIRKFLRRDSTCQTVTDTRDDVIIPSKDILNGGKKPLKKDPVNNEKAEVTKGKKTLETSADAKLSRIQNENDEDKTSQGALVENSISINGDDLSVEKISKINIREVDTEKEAERIAIEKIEVVVKDAEDRASEASKKLRQEKVLSSQMQ